MIVVGFIALAAIGSLARVIISHHLNKTGFPYGTLLINMLGSFLFGIIANSSSDTVIVFGIGALGAMTTFSTLSQEAIQLGRGRRFFTAIFYVTTTLVAGVLAAWGGLLISD